MNRFPRPRLHCRFLSAPPALRLRAAHAIVGALLPVQSPPCAPPTPRQTPCSPAPLLCAPPRTRPSISAPSSAPPRAPNTRSFACSQVVVHARTYAATATAADDATVEWDPEGPAVPLPRLPFRFETGVGLFPKETKTRPFPPPFLSPPSGSFSDALSTHGRPKVNGQLLRGVTNGDDAVYAGDYFICANDGVGAWSKRPRGHAGLWSRLLLHFWVTAIEKDTLRHADPDPSAPLHCRPYEPDAIAYLEEAHAAVTRVTTGPAEYFGTTTATGAQLHFRLTDSSSSPCTPQPRPIVHVTNLGDSQVLIVRPSTRQVVFRSEEQWHWFDCPRQLGSNSTDSARENAQVTAVDVQVGDVVLAMSDGVIDNLWGHEVVDVVLHAMERWTANEAAEQHAGSQMQFTAQALLDAAKVVAMDVYAESPYMERAIDMGAMYE
ncbi:hypothetical protein TD95_005208, partial [Thielaviopsis punctulata]